MGSEIGQGAWQLATHYYDGTVEGPGWGLHYADWAAIRLDGQDTDPDAVVAPDGINNRTLYSFGLTLDPTDRDGLPQFVSLVDDPTMLELSYTRPVAVADLEYRLEYTTDLKTWQPVPSEILTASVLPERIGNERHTIRIANGPAAPRFYRLRVLSTVQGN